MRKQYEYNNVYINYFVCGDVIYKDIINFIILQLSIIHSGAADISHIKIGLSHEKKTRVF